MGEKNYGKSVRAKLLNISKAEKLGYQLIVIRYIQERLLYRLSQSRFREKLFLKGGALLYALEQFRARPTLDIDFLGDKISRDKEFVKMAFEVNDIAGGEISVGGYVDTVLRQHLEQHKERINELYKKQREDLI